MAMVLVCGGFYDRRFCCPSYSILSLHKCDIEMPVLDWVPDNCPSLFCMHSVAVEMAGKDSGGGHANPPRQEKQDDLGPTMREMSDKW